MGVRDAINGFVTGLRGRSVPVTDAMHTTPTAANVPRSWSNRFMGPGQPLNGMLAETARDRDADVEPRTFQYMPQINATMSPRLAYGLLPFTDLRGYAETVPEVAQCVRILTEELKTFEPRIVDKAGKPVNIDRLKWLTTSPDRVNPWPVWLSRFLYNTLVYDAPACYTPRVGKKISALRVIDGSTIFVLVDDHGEIPRPPAPAFQQIIYGVPRGMFNTYQLWYRPRHLRADAPYGRSPIEDCLPAVKLMQNIWSYQESWYTTGTMPEQLVTAPESWTVDQILQFEDTWNARQAGNTEERAGRLRMLPAGTNAVVTKDVAFKKEEYEAAANTIRMTYGIPRTEFGESPGSGLGGSGFLEAMQSVFYRMGIGPLKAFLEGFFNEVLEQNQEKGLTWQLAFPQESIDPNKEEDRHIGRFTQGVITRNETRQAIGLQPLPGPEGNEFATPGGPGEGEPGAGPSRFSMADLGPEDKIPVSQKIPVTDKIPVAGGKIPVNSGTIPVVDKVPVAKGAGLNPADDAYFGAPASGAGRAVTVGSDRLPSRPADWYEGLAPDEEAVYLLDRALASTDELFLVPVTYQATIDGVQGVVTVKTAGTRGYKDLTRYAPEVLEQAAVVDYIAGVTREPGQWRTHPEEPERVILTITGGAFTQPSSPFIQAAAGNPISENMKLSLQAVIGDQVLWRDIEECVGQERAQAARERAVELQQRMMIPAGA